MTFEQYYTDNFEKWVKYLSRKIGNLEEAENRVQDIFTSLSDRREFCEKLLGRDALDKYIQGAMMLQIADFFRDRSRRISTVNFEDTKALAEFAEDPRSNEMMKKIELNNFYDEAIKLFTGTRKLRRKKFDNIGKFYQYLFIQHLRNGKTFEEIGGSLGLRPQGLGRSWRRIITIITPLLEKYLGGKLNIPGNDLREIDN